MAKEVVTIHIMPVDPEIDLEAIAVKVLEAVKEFTNNPEVETKKTITPVAFGLNRLEFIVVREEGKGDMDGFLEKLTAFEGVNSADVADLRRAIG